MVIGPTARAAAKILAKAKHKARAVAKKSRRKVNKRILSRKVLNEVKAKQKARALIKTAHDSGFKLSKTEKSLLTPRLQSYRHLIPNRKWRKENPEQVRAYLRRKRERELEYRTRPTSEEMRFVREKARQRRLRYMPGGTWRNPPTTPYRDQRDWSGWSQQPLSLSAAEAVARRAKIRALQMKAVVKKQSVRNVGANPLRKGSTKAQMKAKVDAMRRKLEKIQKAKAPKIVKSKSKKIVKKKGRKKGRKR